MATIKNKIIPNLWFDRQAEEAEKFYTSVFKNSGSNRIIRASKAGFEIHGLPEGTVMTVEFEIEGKFYCDQWRIRYSNLLQCIISCRCNTKDRSRCDMETV